jgi:hypothetical protein
MANIIQNQPSLKQIFGSIHDFKKNYYDMRDDETIGGDKYFHCKANFEATRRGKLAEIMATILSDLRELSNARSNQSRKGLTEQQSIEDCAEDQFANKTGRQNAKNVIYKDAKDGCKQFRVRGINEKY